MLRQHMRRRALRAHKRAAPATSDFSTTKRAAPARDGQGRAGQEGCRVKVGAVSARGGQLGLKPGPGQNGTTPASAQLVAVLAVRSSEPLPEPTLRLLAISPTGPV